MRFRFPLFCLTLLQVGCFSTPQSARHAGPWDVTALSRAPGVEWGKRLGLVQEVYYEGEPYGGRATRVFAYLARPEGDGPFPAMVLVHGGGGKAFREWAVHWAKRGYVALAPDTAGCGPEGRLPDGGPGQDDATKFSPFTTETVREMWSYHAIAAVIRGHSLIRTLPEVDPQRIGVTGISWGGYLTCIAAGIDARFKVAVPVYGCGFLGENSVWKDAALAGLPPKTRELWLSYFDPSNYLRRVRCPILFLNGSNDFAYPLDSYRASYRLVPHALRSVSVVTNLPHGHIWSFEEVDAFVDATLKQAAPLPRLGPMKRSGDRVEVRYSSSVRLSRAELTYTTDSGDWRKRVWKTEPAEVEDSRIRARLPEDRPLVYYVAVIDDRGLRISTEHAESTR